MILDMLNRRRCPQCGAWHARNLRLCPSCGHEDADGREGTLCGVCGASLLAGQRICPYCGTARPTRLAGAFPAVGRIVMSLAIISLGALLVWWILPLGFDPQYNPTPAVAAAGGPSAEAIAVAAQLQETVASAPLTVAPTVGAALLDTATPESLILTSQDTPASEEPTASAVPTLDATATAAPTATADSSAYTVVQGDVLGRIAMTFGVPLEALLDVNGLSDNSLLTIGDVLIIPTAVPTTEDLAPAEAPTAIVSIAASPSQSASPTATAAATASGPIVHRVVAGDTLGAIAVRYRVDSDVIAAENDLSMNAVLRIGQELIIPGAVTQADPTATATVTPTPSPTVTPTVSPTATQAATIGPRTWPTPASGTASSGTTLSATATRTGTARASATLPPVASPTASPTAFPTATPTPAPTLRVHVIQPGEHIGVVAAIYDLTMGEIAAANGISISAILQVGQQLVIPGPEGAVAPETPTMTSTPASVALGSATAVASPEPVSSASPEPQIHVVQRGDTLGGIAVRYQVDSEVIAQANGLYLTSVLGIGQELVIPGVTPEPTPAPTVEGYDATTAPPASPTPTLFPYRTRPVSGQYRQPRLLAPVNGAVLVGADSAPVLQWISVGILASDEWYQVRLWTPDGGAEPEVFRTRATSWRVEADLYPRSRRSDRFLWDVTVIREQAAAPGAVDLSVTSMQRAFRWR